MINTELLQKMIDEGWVVRQSHPNAALFIYNYTQAAQYERMWNEVTLACRGLILDAAGRVVARPFPKFFNYGEIEDQVIPNERFEVYEKMDGSLGILYWIDQKPFIATRGSFNSEQAQIANRLLHNNYAAALAHLDTANTYLFEIIYPENRIVVDYGNTEALVLLAIIDTATGADLPLLDLGFPMVQRFDGLNELERLKTLETENREGFVVKFQNGLRIKIKFEEYVRIHRIITQVSSITIWEFLKDDQALDTILDRVPDEFYQWVRKTIASLEQAYKSIETEARAEFKTLETRKETALYFMTCKHTAILFKMLENRNYAPIIWKMLRPTHEKPFSNQTQDL
jgi:T4 RnlA family RNA ligase